MMYKESLGEKAFFFQPGQDKKKGRPYCCLQHPDAEDRGRPYLEVHCSGTISNEHKLEFGKFHLDSWIFIYQHEGGPEKSLSILI